MSGDRLRLLLVAPGCDGTDVGENLTAFQLASRLADRHDVTVLSYHKRTQPRAAGQLPGARVIEWVDVPLGERFERFHSMLNPGYVAFHARARRWVQRALAAGDRFDLAHQVTPLALRYPSPAAGLGIPLVVGPLGGSLPTPRAFRDELAGVPWYTHLRAIDGLRLRHDPVLRHTLTSAQAVIGVAPYVADLLRPMPLRRFDVMTDTGLAQLPPPPSRGLSGGDRDAFRLLFVGRVIRAKGVRDAVRALAHLADQPAVTLDVVGDGEDRQACEREAASLGLAHRVRFWGQLPRARVDEFYAGADAFVFPSFREPSGNVVIEAMSHGLPMVVADRGGPGHVVTDACGIRVPVTTPEHYPVDLAAAVRRLVTEWGLADRLGLSARRRVADDFLWDRKIDHLDELYADLLAPFRARSDVATRRTA